MELSSLFKDVASIIAEKCINPKTQRPYTITMIERALKDCHFSVDPKRSAKQQALQASPRPLALALELLLYYALRNCQSSVDPKRSAKQQALPHLASLLDYLQIGIGAMPACFNITSLDAAVFYVLHDVVLGSTRTRIGNIEE